jgi:hypothetical protein
MGNSAINGSSLVNLFVDGPAWINGLLLVERCGNVSPRLDDRVDKGYT